MASPTLLQQLQLLLLFAVNAFGLALRPGLLRILITLPITLFLVAQSIVRTDKQYYGDEYSINCFVVTLSIVYIDWVVLANPDRERWHKVRSETKGETAQGKDNEVPTSFLGRLWWSFRLSFYMRFVGWSSQVKNIPPRAPVDMSRWTFLGRKLLRALILFFVQDTFISFGASTPVGTFRGLEDTKVFTDYWSRPFWTRFGYAWVHIVVSYSGLEWVYCAFCILAVALGLSTPRDCPRLNNDLRTAYTVRNSWSLTWHQMVRRSCQMFGLLVARDVLRLRKGSFASKYVQLFAGFFVSAFLHGVAAMLSNRAFKDNGEFIFFMGQAVVIFVEDHVIEFGQYLGLRENLFWHLVGYLWVIAWFGVSLQIYVGGTLDKGMWVHRRSVDLFGIGPPKASM